MKTNAKKIGFSILYALSRAGRAIANFFKDAFKHMPYAFHVVIHPFDGFFRLKTETRRHSVPCAVLLYVFLAVSTVLRKQSLNFMFTEDANLDMNIFLGSAVPAVGHSQLVLYLPDGRRRKLPRCILRYGRGAHTHDGVQYPADTAQLYAQP